MLSPAWVRDSLAQNVRLEEGTYNLVEVWPKKPFIPYDDPDYVTTDFQTTEEEFSSSAYDSVSPDENP